MTCPECDRLRVERERLNAAYDTALFNLREATPRAPLDRYMILKTLADDAKIDMEAIETEIARHRHANAVAN